MLEIIERFCLTYFTTVPWSRFPCQRQTPITDLSLLSDALSSPLLSQRNYFCCVLYVCMCVDLLGICLMYVHACGWMYMVLGFLSGITLSEKTAGEKYIFCVCMRLFNEWMEIYK